MFNKGKGFSPTLIVAKALLVVAVFWSLSIDWQTIDPALRFVIALLVVMCLILSAIAEQGTGGRNV